MNFIVLPWKYSFHSYSLLTTLMGEEEDIEEVDTLREEVVMEEGGEEEVDMVEEVVVVMEEEEEGEVMEEWVVTVGWRFSLHRALDG